MEQIRRLPIGIQSFSDIRQGEYIYVDKTQFIAELVKGSKQYFLSRPRRFDKSLFISTLEEYFLGHRELFTGLALETQEVELAQLQKRDAWIERPVFHLDLAGKAYNEKDSLENILVAHVSAFEKQYGLASSDMTADMRFRQGIVNAYEKTGKQVVVLVDEYDKPLLDNIDNQELLDHYRTILKGFYGVLKPMDKYLHFVFITGITRFDKVSIFSDFNQLRDISVNEKFSAICGVTQEELENNFKPEIEAMAEKSGLTYDECLAKLKQKYDGYHFSYKSDNIYNPFSLVNALADRKFGNYWFATGTPTFLVKMIKDLDMDAEKFEKGFSVPCQIFDNYHIDTETPEPLLYQSGYLTIKSYNKKPEFYTLAYPNEEVKFGFLSNLFPYYISRSASDKGKMEIWHFYEEIQTGDVNAFMKRMQTIFGAMPKKTSEKFYELDGKVVFYLMFKLLGQFIQCEVQNGATRMSLPSNNSEFSKENSCFMNDREVIHKTDAVVWGDEIIYVFEFKLDGTADEALAQIDDKNYAIAYQADGRKIVKIGAVFSSKERNVTEWKISE